MGLRQGSFRKTGTMGMFVSQTEIAVWVQAPGALAPLRMAKGHAGDKCGRGLPLPLWGLVITPRKILRFNMQNPAI